MDGPRRPRLRSGSGAVVVLVRILLLAAVLLVWELAARADIIDVNLSSRPTAIAEVLPGMLVDSNVLAALLHTLGAAGIAFAISLVSGCLIGVGLGLSKILRDAYLGPLLFILSTPKVIFLPIFVMIFGIGRDVAIVMGAFQSFFYITVNVAGAVAGIEPAYNRMAYAFRASPWARFRLVIFPAALPGFTAAVWHGLVQAASGVLVAEFFVASGGVGMLLSAYQANLDAPKLTAMVLLVSAVLVGVMAVWNRLDRSMEKWR